MALRLDRRTFGGSPVGGRVVAGIVRLRFDVVLVGVVDWLPGHDLVPAPGASFPQRCGLPE